MGERVQRKAVVRAGAHQGRQQQDRVEVDPHRLVLRVRAAVQGESDDGEGGLDEEGERLRGGRGGRRGERDDKK